MPAKKEEVIEKASDLVKQNVRFYSQFMTTPKDAQKPFNNGRFSGTDVNPMFRIKKLTEVFGPAGFGWWTQNVHYKFVEADITDPDPKRKTDLPVKETSVFCELELIIRDPETKEVSQPIYGVGGNTYIAQGKYGPRASDEAMKMAYTDALSIACKALGIGHDIWYSNDRTKYTMNSDSVPAAKPESKPAETKPAADSHTEETAALIDEIAKKLSEVAEKMPTKEEREKFAKETIVPIIGKMNYKSCTDIAKLTALRDKLSA